MYVTKCREAGWWGRLNAVRPCRDAATYLYIYIYTYTYIYIASCEISSLIEKNTNEKQRDRERDRLTKRESPTIRIHESVRDSFARDGTQKYNSIVALSTLFMYWDIVSFIFFFFNLEKKSSETKKWTERENYRFDIFIIVSFNYSKVIITTLERNKQGMLSWPCL